MLHKKNNIWIKLFPIKWIFKILKYLFLVDYFIDIKIKKVLFKTRYRLTGQCLKCGLCCESIGVYMPRFFGDKLMMGFIIVAVEKMNDFTFKGLVPEEKMLVFKCKHYNKEKNKCDIYRFRPSICHNYPIVRYFEKPVLFDSCGYKVSVRD